MSKSVAAEYIATQKHYVYNQDEAADTNPEAVGEMKGHDCVINQEGPHQVREAQEIAMKILQDQGKASLTEIRLARLADRTGWGISPDRLEIRAAIVVTGESKEAGNP